MPNTRQTLRTLELCEQPDTCEQELCWKEEGILDAFDPFPSSGQGETNKRSREKENSTRPGIKEKIADYLSSDWIDEVVGDREEELRAHDIIEEIQNLRTKISGLIEELGQINMKKLSSSLFGNVQSQNEKKLLALTKSIKSWDKDKLLGALDKVMRGLPDDSDIRIIVEKEFQDRVTNNFNYIGVLNISITTEECLDSIGNNQCGFRHYMVVDIFDSKGNRRGRLECEPGKIADVNKYFLLPTEEFIIFVESNAEFAEWREIRSRVKK